MTNSARRGLFTAQERQGDVSEKVDAAVSMEFSVEAKRAIEVLAEAMYSICYIYDDNYCALEYFHQAGTEEAPAKAVYVLVFSRPYNGRVQQELQNIRQNVFGPSDMDDFCALAKVLTNPRIHGDLSCSAIHLS